MGARGRPAPGSPAGPAQAAGAAGLEFLFDDTWVDRRAGVRRVLGSPVKHPGPVLKPEAAWEADGVYVLSVLHDAAEHKFKMWYRAACPGEGKPPPEREAVGQRFFLCYAESQDGVLLDPAGSGGSPSGARGRTTSSGPSRPGIRCFTTS